jgi:acyl-coenzyme A synthetase/AMP-(fatty) acid ligase
MLRPAHRPPEWPSCEDARADNPPTGKELHELIRSRLAPAKVPRDWYLAGQMPTNAMGKLQKFMLRNQITDRALERLPPC